MIDLVYKTLQTIINKENQGYISPTEFDLLAKKAQLEIFREYFEDENRDKNRQNRGLTNSGYSNLAFNERQRITQFAAIATLSYDAINERYDLPTDLYFVEDDGLTVADSGRVIDEIQRSNIGYASLSIAKPSDTFPVYEPYKDFIKVFPASVNTDVTCRYLRQPADPKWTFIVVNGVELYNPSATDFQDFELHPSEFTHIIMKMLGDFGLNLREQEIIQIAEVLKDKNNVKEEN